MNSPAPLPPREGSTVTVRLMSSDEPATGTVTADTYNTDGRDVFGVEYVHPTRGHLTRGFFDSADIIACDAGAYVPEDEDKDDES